MDIAHKQYLEGKSHDELVQIVMDHEEIIKVKERDIFELRTILNEKQLLIDTLLKVIKYQNNIGD